MSSGVPTTPGTPPEPHEEINPSPWAFRPLPPETEAAPAGYGESGDGHDRTSDGHDRTGDRHHGTHAGHQGGRQSFYRRRIAPIGAAIVAFLAKIKSILLLLPKLKLLVTAGSMAVSLAAYASIWGFSFALGFVVLLLVHEMGHVIELRRQGIRASAPMFIPFLGAVVASRSLGDNALAEARVGLAGPVLGTIGSVACLVIWQLTGHTYWQALAYTGLFLNLFNLLPVVPLDGGRAMAAMTPWMWGLGFAGIVVLAVAFPNPIIFLIGLLAAYETYRRWQARRAASPEQEAYYRVAPRDRLFIGIVYIGLVAALVVGMHATHLARSLI